MKERMRKTHYDYIITGAGCAGLSLAMHLLQQKALQQKSILVVDESAKQSNDRTWCFWERSNGLFESIVCKQWEVLRVESETFSGRFAIAPYRYKMIRGIDFYRHCLHELKQQPQVEILQGKVERIFSETETGVVVDGQTLTAAYVFNSILFEKPGLKKNEVWLLQHFKGWMVQTKKPVFCQQEATLMDFRVSQENGTTFCYSLPLAPDKALIEYTLFTPSLLPAGAYDHALAGYLRDVLKIEDYTVAETEFGLIPMTSHRFPSRQHQIINMGTAGGQTKGSSGYTFYFIQQHSRQIAESLAQRGHPFVKPAPPRFRFYDSVLLQVLAQNAMPGGDVFTTLFRKNKPQNVLAFLNNASSLSTELRILSTLPTLPFLKAALRQFK